MRKTVILAMGGLLVAGPAFAQSVEQRDIRISMPAMKRSDIEAQVKSQFQKLDADKDGAVTRAEIAAQRASEMKAMQDTMFAAMDADKNGSISRAEFDQHHASMSPIVAEAMAGLPDMPGIPPLPPMAHMDAHESHDTPSAPDAAQAPKAPATPAQRRIVMIRQHSKGPVGPMMLMMDNGRMFDMADENKDGKVTQTEALNTALARFDRADANKDGILAAEERGANRMKIREVIKMRRAEKNKTEKN